MAEEALLRSSLTFLVLLALIGPLAAQETMMKSDKPSSDASGMKAGADRSAFDLAGLGPRVTAYPQVPGGSGPLVYYFAAVWNPASRGFYQDLKSSGLPPGVRLVFVNFDKNPTVVQKYGVQGPHTFVSVGPQGESLRTWTGPSSVKALADVR